MLTLEATSSWNREARQGTRSVAAVACDHCRLPVPAGLMEPDAPRQFCCQGCRTAWNVIHSSGLERFYELAQNSASAAAPASVPSAAERYATFDDPAFQKMYARDAGAGLCDIELRADGVHCAACLWLLERLGRAAGDGVVRSRLDLRRAMLSITWDPARVKLSRIAATAHALGYPLHPPRGVSAREARRRESRSQLARIGVAGAIMGNVMLVALALYSGVFDGAGGMDPAMSAFFRRLSMAMGLVSLAWPGSTFFRGAWAAVRTRCPSMDVPIAVGLALGGAWGVSNAVRGTGEVYFDTITTLVFLLLLGRWIQSQQQHRAADAVEMLYALTPSTARLVDGDMIRIVPVESLGEGGATIEVLAGETIPVDGVISAGRTDVDVSLLTGESRPVASAVGDTVHAGAVNLTSSVRISVQATGEATRVGKLMRLVEEAAQRRAPIVRLADHVALVFVPVVLVLAAVTAAIWWFINPEVAIDNAAALLITTCPCALGLATPLAVIAGIGRAARRGILVKGGDTLEALSRSRGGIIILDKTGTITRGTLEVVKYDGSSDALNAAAALEAGTSHPVARALVAAAVPVLQADVTNVTHTLGRGVCGIVDSRKVAVGSVEYIRSGAHAIPAEMEATVVQSLSQGLSVILIAVDGVVAGVASLGDKVREDSQRAINELRRAGWEVRILSGDEPSVVSAVAKQVGLSSDNCKGGASPEDKLEEVGRLVAASPDRTIVMVGDGVNDAAALAAATVGVAVHGGAEASMGAAAVYLARPGLSPLVELLQGSGRTLGVIRRNLVFSLLYNILFVTLAMLGVLTPLIAAIVMPFSSLTVVLSSTRTRAFGGAAWA